MGWTHLPISRSSQCSTTGVTDTDLLVANASIDQNIYMQFNSEQLYKIKDMQATLATYVTLPMPYPNCPCHHRLRHCVRSLQHGQKGNSYCSFRQ